MSESEIVKLIQHTVELKVDCDAAGEQIYQGKCPFEHKPHHGRAEIMVWPRGRWACVGCGRGGGVAEFKLALGS